MQITSNKPAVQFKGSMCTVTVLHLLATDPERIRYQLKEAINKNPDFFKNAPVIIDLHALSLTAEIVDFNMICHELRSQGLIPVGIRNACNQHKTHALKAGLACLPPTNINQTEKPSTNNKLVTQPVRSGQKIYVENGDLIVMAPVSAGAEVMADGNIHIYNTLRGRALAGMQGDEQARIFCQQLSAELISIAGYYQTSDKMAPPKHPYGLCITLQDQQLQFHAFKK